MSNRKLVETVSRSGENEKGGSFYDRSNYLQAEWTRDLVRRAYLMNHSAKDFEYLKQIKARAQHIAETYDMPVSFVRDARFMAEDKLFKLRLIQLIEQEGLEKGKTFLEVSQNANASIRSEDLQDVLISPEAWERAQK